MSFGTSFDERMETYYQRFIDLQEKLRKRERSHYRRLRSQYKRFLDEDRKRQERNEKIMRALERIESRISLLSSKTERFKYLRRQYKSYFQRLNQLSLTSEPVDENYHPEDSYKHLENKSSIKNTNEEKLEVLEKYLKSLNSHKKERYDPDTPKAPNYEEDLKKLDMFSKSMKDGFDSTKANSIAEEIMNSIYSRHYKKGDGLKKPKLKYVVNRDNSDYDDDDHDNNVVKLDQNQTHHDSILKTSSTGKRHVRMNETDYGIQKVYDRAEHDEEDLLVPETIRNDSIEAPQETRLAHVGSEKDYIEAVSHDVVNGNKVQGIEAQRANKYDNMLETRQNNLNPSKEINEPISHTEKSGPVEKHNDPNGELVHQSILKNLESGAQDGSYQERCEDSSPGNKVGQVEWSQKDADQSERARDKLPNDKTDDFEVNQKQNVGRSSEGAGQHQVVHSDTQNGTETGQLDDNSDLFQQHKNSSTDQRYDGGESKNNENGQSVAQNDENIQLQQHQDQLHCEETDQPVQQQYQEYDQMTQQFPKHDPSSQQYSEAQAQYDENGQPIAQYDEKGQLLQYQEDDPKARQYAEGQIHDNENGQLIQQHREDDPNQVQYIEGQYDENGQLLQQYQAGDTNTGQYAEGQYDQNDEPIVQYDENGQLIQQYQEDNPNAQQYGASQLQYDENGQPLPQYDENGQINQQYQEDEQYVTNQLQYDESGQPIPQYDENGQLIQRYQEGDPNVEQYAVNQLQYEESGQPVPQYDENGQLIQQYQEDDQTAGQYAANQLQYDESGQLIPQYDEHGQLIQQYQDDNPNVEQYTASHLQYDENGQPILQYDENGQLIQQYLEDDPNGAQYTGNQIQYDENGQPMGQYVQEYDPNAQYYDENGQPVNYSETAQLYDVNGQLIQQHSENNQQLRQGYEEGGEVEDKEQAFGEKVNIEATPDTKKESKEFNVLELLETDTDVSVKENTSKITNDSDFDFSNA